ncbi:S1 family peptidase, partial [Actinomadura welshii]|uniref:S1 family peptidase n=2 Tax=Actinomadura livida TaxID=79909 RepID=A0A7W7IFE1_9ACTN|nr:S1 family peptidase [Actinomadura catellatispora]MBB4776109.1 streptogrisin D [Actinomadura catellatispora]
MRTAVTWTAVAAGSAGLVAGSLYVVRMPDRSGDEKQAALTGEQASEARRGSAGVLAARLTDRLGARTAGAYLDPAGRPVVTVTNEGDAAMVRAAGAVPKLTERSPAALNRITATLRQSMTGVPGTGWAVDPATSRVTMWTDDSVTGTRMATVRRTARQMGSAVRMVHIDGRLRPLAFGGDAIFGQGSRCSLGFNVVRNGQPFFLTAGHCGNSVRNWTADQGGSQFLGRTVASSFPGDDFALVRTAQPGQGAVNLYNGQARDITEAGEAVVGQRVVRTGSTTGLATGRVTATNATVNYPEGTVSGLIQTTVCAEPGDSGGPLFSGSTALGLTSGGSGNCQIGGVTFFQPVTEPLEAFGAEVS